MMEYRRRDASFSLCGLNCLLCPRYHTEGSSRCPGCGGPEFSQKHPTCAVVTCSRRHGNVEYCFLCSEFPCRRYKNLPDKDSFITYKNVLRNFSEAEANLKKYLSDLRSKEKILEELITRFNDGRSKGFYCLAVNLLPLAELKAVMKIINNEVKNKGISLKEKAKEVTALLTAKCDELGIEPNLRK